MGQVYSAPNLNRKPQSSLIHSKNRCGMPFSKSLRRVQPCLPLRTPPQPLHTVALLKENPGTFNTRVRNIVFSTLHDGHDVMSFRLAVNTW